MCRTALNISFFKGEKYSENIHPTEISEAIFVRQQIHPANKKKLPDCLYIFGEPRPM
jgi:hypothetical protein